MTQDEIVDLGKVLRAVTEMQGEVKELRATTHHLATESMRLRHTIRRLPCMGDVDAEPDTDPDCPALLSDMPPAVYRERLRSVGDDEPDSVVTRPISVHAGPLSLRGPGVVIGVLLLLCVALLVVGRRWWFRM